MFQRTVIILSNYQLCNSDRETLRALIKQNYPMLTDDDLLAIIPNNDSDEVTLVTGKTLHYGTVRIYTINQLPTLFMVGCKPIPTVYLLWRFPQLLPTFTTYLPVLEKFTNGSDLTIPDVIYPNFYAINQEVCFPSGTPVQINLTTNIAAVAVGMTIMTTENMYKNPIGQCVRIWHVHGDSLCTLNNIACVPLSELGVFESKTEMEPSTSAFRDDDSSSISDSCELSDCMDNTEEHAESLEACAKPQVDEEKLALKGNDDRQALDFDSADDLLMHCFFACLKFSTSKIELPILISEFYKNHLLEQCPPDQHLDIAKTSYRNIFNFFDCMVDLGVITMITVTPKTYQITDINYKHPCLLEFTLNPAYGPHEEDVVYNISKLEL